MTDFESTRRQHLDAARTFTAEAIRRLSWSRNRVLEEQIRRLRKVVAEAQRHSPFHAARLSGFEATTLELSDLANIPPMTKQDVMANWDAIVTDRRLHLEDVDAHVQRLHSGEDDNPYFLGEYYAAATGGTSGKRGLFLWDRESFIVTANITYRMERRQDRLNPPDGPLRTAVICAGSYAHASRFLFPAVLDPKREVRVFPAGLALDRMVDQLNRYQPDRIVGYASIVQELCALALEGKLQLRLNRISTNSEPLYPEARRMAREAWGIDIHNSWGSVEIGLAATEGESFTGVSLAEDFLIFEAVDTHDRPVDDPAQADRVLVTKLFGNVLPMIRYEMTDSMVFDDGRNPDAPGCRRVLEIKGRADDWFVYRGDLKIHPMVFRGVLGQDRHISEYQVRQTPDGARVLAITHGDFSAAEVADALVRILAETGLPEPKVDIERVTALPRHPETDKLKRFVPLER